MITFGELAGLLAADFLQARRTADMYSASLSEEYHVNPLLRGMPVPRYTIAEAEIDLPLRIMGVRKTEIGEEEIQKILDKIRRGLPTLLYRNIKNCYYDKQAAMVREKSGVVEPEEVGISMRQQEEPRAQVVRLSQVPELRACYKASTAAICTLMNQYMATYVKENSVSEMKLLDFTDVFIETLYRVCKEEFSTYLDVQTPYINKEALKKMCQTVGSTMFFEFREIFEQPEGLLVSPETGQMEQNFAPEQLMRVKMKIREQDVSFVVDQNEESGEKRRFLTLG